jgi:hypothetical protein
MVEADRLPATASGEMYLFGGMYSSLRVTRLQADKINVGNCGKETHRRWRCCKDDADLPKNILGITGKREEGLKLLAFE